jgi:hypothetical protein
MLLLTLLVLSFRALWEKKLLLFSLVLQCGCDFSIEILRFTQDGKKVKSHDDTLLIASDLLCRICFIGA